jgi:hypothetical protein
MLDLRRKIFVKGPAVISFVLKECSFVMVEPISASAEAERVRNPRLGIMCTAYEPLKGFQRSSLEPRSMELLPLMV